MAIQNAAYRDQPKGKFGLGGITPRGGNNGPNARQYFPSSEQHTGASTMDMMRYTNPFTGEEQTGSSTNRNFLNQMADKYGTNGDYFEGVDRNAQGNQIPPGQIPVGGPAIPLPGGNGGGQPMQQPQQRPMLPIPDPTTYEGNFAEPFFKTGFQEAFRQYNQGGPQFFGGPTVAGFSPQQLESQRQLQGLAPNLQQQGQLQQAALANQLGQDVRQFNMPGQVNAPGQVSQVGALGGLQGQVSAPGQIGQVGSFGSLPSQVSAPNQVGQVGAFGSLPGQVSAPGQIGQVGVGSQVAREGIQGISSELQQAMTNPILRQLQDQTLPGISSGATQAGAFGGSRQGILENQARTGATGAMADALARATLQQRQQDIGQRGQDIQQGQFGTNVGLQQRGQDIQQGQFGANLGQSQRQYDIGTGLQSRGQDLNQRSQDIQQGQFGTNVGLQQRQADIGSGLQARGQDLNQRGQDIQQGQFGANLGVGQRQFDIGTGLQSRGQDLNQRSQDIQQGQFGSQFLSGQRQQDIGSQLQQRGQNLGSLAQGQGAAAGVRQGLTAGPSILGGVGAQQQQMNQQLINAARERFSFGQTSQQRELNNLLQQLSGMPQGLTKDKAVPASGTDQFLSLLTGLGGLGMFG